MTSPIPGPPIDSSPSFFQTLTALQSQTPNIDSIRAYAQALELLSAQTTAIPGKLGDTQTKLRDAWKGKTGELIADEISVDNRLFADLSDAFVATNVIKKLEDLVSRE